VAEGLEDHAGEAVAEALSVRQRELEPDLVQDYFSPRDRSSGRRRLPRPFRSP
jgi:hypothetical protein